MRKILLHLDFIALDESDIHSNSNSSAYQEFENFTAKKESIKLVRHKSADEFRSEVTLPKKRIKMFFGSNSKVFYVFYRSIRLHS